ncbi:histidine kinase [Massilia phosphatilytica]|nr:histidine kinase [Massilia phosphatilytica]
MNIVIISEDRQLLQNIQTLLARTGHEIALAPGKSSELSACATDLAPDLLLLDARHRQAIDFAQIERVSLERPGMTVILLADTDSPAFLMEAMRAGVREVLPSLQPAQPLFDAVERAAAKVQAAQAMDTAKVHAFIGTSGGSGTTFLVTNFGYQLAQFHKVLLVDLNLQFGDALSYLQDGKAPRTIDDICRDIKRLDAPLLAASTIKITPNYSILAAPEEPSQATDVKPEHVAAILKLAATQYDIVLLDLPRMVDATLISALDQAASIFLVLQASVPHLRNADKLLSVFRSLDYTRDKIELIVNRYEKRSDITLDKIKRTLGPLEIHTIANGYRQVSTAINQGVPLVQLESRHGVIRNLSDLGDTVTPPADHPAGLFERLFRRA